MRRLPATRSPAGGRFLLGLLAGSLLALALPASAAERTVTLDPEKTKISFSLGAVMHTVHGTLKLESGEVRFDPETGAASGRIVVDAKSANTGNESRDRDMHAKVLESERFPQFVLEVARVEGRLDPGGTSKLTLKGKLAIHGSTHEVAWPAEVTVEGAIVRAKASFKIPYVAWGMKDPSGAVLRVAKEVPVTVEAVGKLSS